MHWHSLYSTNESSGQHISEKAFGHSFLTTPLHPKWSDDWVFTAWPCQRVDSPADLKHSSTRKSGSVNDNLMAFYLLHLTDFQCKWTGKKNTNNSARLGSFWFICQWQLPTRVKLCLSTAEQTKAEGFSVAFLFLPLKWRNASLQSSLPCNVQLPFGSQMP